MEVLVRLSLVLRTAGFGVVICCLSLLLVCTVLYRFLVLIWATCRWRIRRVRGVIQRKSEIFGEKFRPVSLFPTHGWACNLTRGSAARRRQVNLRAAVWPVDQYVGNKINCFLRLEAVPDRSVKGGVEVAALQVQEWNRVLVSFGFGELHCESWWRWDGSSVTLSTIHSVPRSKHSVSVIQTSQCCIGK